MVERSGGSMKKLRISEAKVFEILQEGTAGIPLDEICRKYGISRSTYYKLRSKYEGMELSDLKRLRQLEDENQKLKHMYADLSLEHKILKDVIEKKLKGQLSD
jgi:putative transposase